MKRRFPQNFWTDPSENSASESYKAIELPSKRIQFLEDPQAYIASLVEQVTGPAVGAIPFGDDAALFVPHNYEAKYPYPLVLWLHDHSGNENNLFEVMPQISDQNYLGLALRGDVALNSTEAEFTFEQSEAASKQLAERLQKTIGEVRRSYNVHTERIIVAGSGAGATMALRLMLDRPEWFGGAIALNGEFPEMEHPLANYRELQQKRILLGTSSHESAVSAESIVKMGRLLHVAGADVSTQVYDADQRLTAVMLRDINRWIMDGVAATNLTFG